MYQDKDERYYSTLRADLLGMIHGEQMRVLEIGCGAGTTLAELKRSGKASCVVGVDLCSFHGQLELDACHVGDCERLALPYEAGSFDLLIMADVLEHLVDPWTAIRKYSMLLRPGGQIIVSLPNIRELTCLWRIAVRGDFRYEDAGILDRTHLRFFCLRNMLDLVNSAPGLKVDETHYVLRKRRIFDVLTFKRFKEFLAFHFLIRATKLADASAQVV